MKNLFTSFMIWFSVSLFSLIQFFLQVSGNTITNDIQNYFHISTGQVGLLFSSFFWSYLLTQIPAGIILDKFGTKKVLLPTVLILSSGCIGFALTDSYYIAILSRIIMGIGAGFGFIGMVFAISKNFSPKYFPLLLGLGELLGMVGSGIGQFLAPYLIISFKWQSLLWISAVICIITAVLILLFMPNESESNPNKKNILKETYVIFQKVSRIKTVWLCGLFGLGTFAVLTAFADVWGADYLIKVQNLNYIEASKLISLIFIGIAIGSPILGKIGKNLKRKINIMVISVLVMLCLSLSILYLKIDSTAVYGVMMLGLGIASSVYLFSFSILNDTIDKKIIGSAIGFCNTIILFGAVIFQPLTGFLLDILKYHAHRFQIAMICFPAAIFLSLAISLFFILFSRRVN